MNTSPDLTRAIRSWLREDEHESADRVLDIVLASLDTTPQRRSWWPARRSNLMNNVVRVAIAAAAVVVVAFVGIRFVPVGPGAQPTPSPTPKPFNFIATPGGGAPLAPGRWELIPVSPLRVTLTLPADWYKGVLDWAIFASRGETISVAFSAVQNLYLDPCDNRLGLRLPAVGPSVDDLVAALSDIPGLTSTAPLDVTLGGYAAKRLDLTRTVAPAQCTDDPSLWLKPDGLAGPPAPGVGDRARLWVIDVGGTRLVVQVSSAASTTAQTLAELDAVVNSIKIEIASPAPS